MRLNRLPGKLAAFWERVSKTTLALALVGLLSGCGTDKPPLGYAPDRSLVRRAIAMQVRHTEKDLALQIAGDRPEIAIDRVKIQAIEPFWLADLPTYRVQGTYDAAYQFSDRESQQSENAFEVYLQRQIAGQTWRLLTHESPSSADAVENAAPGDGEPNPVQPWYSYLVRP